MQENRRFLSLMTFRFHSSSMSFLYGPITRTQFVDRTFCCCAPSIWNSSDSYSLSVFTSRLKTVLFDQTFCFLLLSVILLVHPRTNVFPPFDALRMSYYYCFIFTIIFYSWLSTSRESLKIEGNTKLLRTFSQCGRVLVDCCCCF